VLRQEPFTPLQGLFSDLDALKDARASLAEDVMRSRLGGRVVERSVGPGICPSSAFSSTSAARLSAWSW